VFSRLSSPVIDGVAEQDGVIVVRARTASWPVPFPGRGALTGQVQGFSRPDGRGRACGQPPGARAGWVRRISVMGRLRSPSLGTDGPVLEIMHHSVALPWNTKTGSTPAQRRPVGCQKSAWPVSCSDD
jgi:hypothetical protein